MFSFRQKIFITYTVVFLVFIALIFPFVKGSVHNIVYAAMDHRAQELISKMQKAPTNAALIRRLKNEKPRLFFRVSIVNNNHKILYDSHTKKLLGQEFSQHYIVSHPEVLDAFKFGEGYSEGFSRLLKQDFVYLAKAFDFHGKTYVIRIAFPANYVHEIMNDLKVGFALWLVAILLLFSVMTWFVINYLTRPIRQITEAIQPYQEGEQTTIPDIVLTPRSRKDEFARLADTLNSLKSKILSHIDILTYERNEKEAVLESLTEGVVAVDDNMKVTYVNHMALKLLQMKKEDLIGAVVNVINDEIYINLLTKCQKEQKVLTEHKELRIDSERVYLDVVAAPQKEGHGAILVLQDKTSKYKIKEMRKDFVANASHELKTPITIIKGFAETLHEHPEISKEMIHEIMGKILRNCDRMHVLIKDLLTLADIEKIPESRLTDFDITKLANMCANDVSKIHKDADIMVSSKAEGTLKINADQSLIGLALTNLIENAAKYSKGPAHIRVNLEQTKNQIILTVQDKGIGIPKEDLKHVFERFYTVDKAKSRKMGGSGLGLSIVHNIIEKHYGTITVDSEKGIGTTFTILLPRTRPSKKTT